MEKRRPHYRLPEIQTVVADPASRPFTRTAIEGGRAMGLTETQMREVVCGLTPSSFYKAMTTEHDSTLWQDVYHAQIFTGETAYIKITGYADGRPPVIQFKAK
ncbi:MAG: type II toxin-antitoxin system MqsR family toxin [Deltaproteobacteria bacterium]|nr:type II toxin-antitoxin system MqsR family toxin [Deltaproteobacteria bacterium]